ncbi:MAG: HAD family hydrolase [Bacteroidota bacterium]
MPKIKAVIFDCDGVLVDSEPISNRVLVEMVNELGGEIDMKFAYDNFKGNSLKNCIETISKIVEISSKENFEKDFRKRSYAAFEKEIQPVKNIENVLQNLKLPFSVASSGPEYKIELNLKNAGLLKYFENHIYSCYSIKKWKPKPDVFLWAAREMNVLPEECLVIEDSVFGIKGALAGGFQVCAFMADGSDSELSSLAHYSVLDMSEVLLLINSLS